MIVFDMQCSDGHTFEGWFKGRDEIDRERKAGRLTCPVCGSQEVQVLLSGGHISKAAAGPETSLRGSSMTKVLNDYIEKNFDNVGHQFAEEAIKMHFGEIDPKNIRGTMTDEEEKDLLEEGIEYIKIPFPKLQS
jgi:hypothetical protein